MWSGTFLVEAAMIACNIPATLNARVCFSKNGTTGMIV
jgi:23S rRNA G2445 N2-methylase RlmL